MPDGAALVQTSDVRAGLRVVTLAELQARGVDLTYRPHGCLGPSRDARGKARSLSAVVINGAEVWIMDPRRIRAPNKAAKYFEFVTADPDRISVPWSPPTISGVTAPPGFVPLPLGSPRKSGWLDLENDFETEQIESGIVLDDDRGFVNDVAADAPDFDHSNPDTLNGVTGTITASERIGTAVQLFSPTEQNKRREERRDSPKKLATQSRVRRKPDGTPRLTPPKPLAFLDPGAPGWREAEHGHHRPEHRWALRLVHGIATLLATPDTREHRERRRSLIWNRTAADLAGCMMRKAYITAGAVLMALPAAYNPPKRWRRIPHDR